jgi:copper chaperone CopZ
VCAVILLAVLVSAALARPEHRHDEAEEGEQKMKVQISGMTCHHCAESVRNALMEYPNVETAVVDHKKGIAHITGRDLDMAKLEEIIDEAGYSFENIEETG